MLGGLFSKILVIMDKNDEEFLHILNVFSLKKKKFILLCFDQQSLRLSPRIVPVNSTVQQKCNACHICYFKFSNSHILKI